MASNEVLVYRYLGVDDSMNATIEPLTDKDGQRRYATMAWISANRNVRLVPGSERSVHPSLVDMNGMCFLPDGLESPQPVRAD